MVVGQQLDVTCRPEDAHAGLGFGNLLAPNTMFGMRVELLSITRVSAYGGGGLAWRLPAPAKRMAAQ